MDLVLSQRSGCRGGWLHGDQRLEYHQEPEAHWAHHSSSTDTAVAPSRTVSVTNHWQHSTSHTPNLSLLFNVMKQYHQLQLRCSFKVKCTRTKTTALSNIYRATFSKADLTGFLKPFQANCIMSQVFKSVAKGRVWVSIHMISSIHCQLQGVKHWQNTEAILCNSNSTPSALQKKGNTASGTGNSPIHHNCWALKKEGKRKKKRKEKMLLPQHRRVATEILPFLQGEVRDL